MLDNLTALTKVDAVRALATLSADEERRLKELQDYRRDFQVSDPKRRARELNLKADRLTLLITHLEELGAQLSDASILSVRSASSAVQEAREAVAVVRKSTFTRDLLPGTGGDDWKRMWEAAGEFYQAAHAGAAFPESGSSSRCPLCQQTIEPDAAARLRHLAEYMRSETEAQVSDAEARYREAFSKIAQVRMERDGVNIAISELAEDDPESAQHIRNFLRDAGNIQQAVKASDTDAAAFPGRGVGAAPVAGLRAVVKTLQDRATRLQVQKAGMEPKVAAELAELEARATLRGHQQAVLDEIERKKRVAAYRQCLDDTTTQPITRKSTELTKELVTDHLRRTFQDELARLEFKHLAVEVQTAGGTKGALFHRLVFTNAPGVAVPDVLSEGESRVLSLAAFLTELSTASLASAIIFDDPVSSLDHLWRKRIAHRLVAEAKGRQVIIFTHDLLFLHLLRTESESQNVLCQHQYVRRDGAIGICSPDLPWVAMLVKDRIGKLRVRWQAAEKTERTSGAEAYEAEGREI